MVIPPPLLACAFRVTLAGETAGFAEVSGLQVEREVLRYRHGMSYAAGEEIVTVPAIGYRTVTLKRGVLPGRGQLYAWLADADGEPRALAVALVDAQERAAAVWKIAHAVPVRLVAPGLDARSGEVAVETLELLAGGISCEAAG